MVKANPQSAVSSPTARLIRTSSTSTPSSPRPLKPQRQPSNKGLVSQILSSSRLADQQIRAKILEFRDKNPGNSRCFNYQEGGEHTAPPPAYICLDFDIFICDSCATIHRMREHRVKSINMAKFSEEEVQSLVDNGGNEKAALKWHKTLDPSFKIPGANPKERSNNAIDLTFVQHTWTGEKPPPNIPAKPTPPPASTKPTTTPPPTAILEAWDKLNPHPSKTWQWLRGLQVYSDWTGDQVCLSEDDPSLESQLQDKLRFVRTSLGLAGEPSGGPFGGTNMLRTLSTIMADADLFHAIEVLDLGSTGVYRAMDNLESYANTLRSLNRPAHPLLLVALARCSVKLAVSPPLAPGLFQCFSKYYTSASEKWMTQSERTLLNAGHAAAPKTRSSSSPPLTAVQLEWQRLCQSGQCKSAAMDELLAMVGLEKVKKAALELFTSALALQRLPPALQQKNKTMTLNYCFTGNPGTGKTTVARLFAQILVDSKLRRNPKLVSCIPQQLKDDGPQAFRDKIKEAMGGVLFIDEAYELEPLVDPRGKPIVADLLVAAEDQRDDLSVILAGYEDDIEKKLYEYNVGLRSRFIAVQFDDFDAKDLLSIWNQLVEERGWRCSDDSVGTIACRRLARTAGRKGFGNARAVRQFLELVVKRAMVKLSGVTGVVANPTLTLVDVVGEQPTANPKLADLLSKIDAMTGWGRIKQRVRDIVDICDKNYAREVGQAGSSAAAAAPLPVMLHRLFLGNPGTGKTTFASLYGQVLKHVNLLSNGDVVKKTASDFIGVAVGDSQKKTSSILEQAKGKVLIIDEAYNLNDELYGKQVLDVLVEKISGSESDDIAVILIGYEAQMTEMLRVQNPGLTSRFPIDGAFYFDDYSDHELLQIFSSGCSERQLQSSLEVDEAVIDYLSKQKRLRNFGNARSVEQLLKTAMTNANQRQAKMGNNGTTIQLAVEDVVGEKTRQSHDAGGDPLKLLDNLYRMDSIREELERLQKRMKIAQANGEVQPSVGHFVFRGSPGTGKTTVARIMGKILFGMGVLASDKVVETSGLNMTGEYVGSTKKKVETQLDEARGAILFIDEAYEMGKGPYGEEALTTLVAAMTDPTYKGMVLIIAGYSHDMETMLSRNSGLKSRFDRVFDFVDWEVHDCVQCLEAKLKQKGYVIQDPTAHVILHELFKQMTTFPGFGNGRDVEFVFSRLLECQAERVFDEQAAGNTSVDRRAVLASDTSSTSKIVLKARTPPPPVPFNMAWTGGAVPMGAFQWTMDQHLPPQRQQYQQLQHQQTLFRREETRQAEQAVQEQRKFEVIEDVEERPGATQTKVAFQRDEGVSDEVWQRLEASKQAYKLMLDQEAERKAEAEAMLKLMLEQEAERQAKAEALRKLMEEQEAERKAKGEAERKAMEEAYRKLMEDQAAERKANEEAARKLREAQEAERKAREEAERRKREAEEAERKAREEAARRLREAEEAAQKAKEEAARRERERQAQQERLRQVGNCPEGYNWHREGGGWRCSAGGHYVSDAELQAHYTY